MATATLPSLEILEPGDALLYSGSGLFSLAIKAKTFSRISHVEGWIGNKRAVASRDGKGVDNYPFRENGLVEVLRPTEPFDVNAALQWYGTVRGRGYDWRQLFTFLRAGKVGKDLENEKAFFCSEFLAAWYRHGGLQVCGDHYPKYAITPGMFRSSPHFRIVWSAL